MKKLFNFGLIITTATLGSMVSSAFADTQYRLEIRKNMQFYSYRSSRMVNQPYKSGTRSVRRIADSSLPNASSSSASYWGLDFNGKADVPGFGTVNDHYYIVEATGSAYIGQNGVQHLMSIAEDASQLTVILNCKNPVGMTWVKGNTYAALFNLDDGRPNITGEPPKNCHIQAISYNSSTPNF